MRSSAAARLRLDPAIADVDIASVRDGRELGTRLAAWAATDGCQGVVRPLFLPAGGAGSWPAAGGVTPTDAWVSRTARPLVVAAGSSPVPRPLPFDLSVRSAYRAQLEDLVRLTTDLDATQQEVATFWAAPPGRPVALVAAEEAVRRGATAPGTRTVLALVDVAVFDALLRCWHVKFATYRARPVQVVPSTGPHRASWTPLLDTPPFPEHTSGHSTASGAAAEVLQSLLGVPDGGVEVRGRGHLGSASGPVVRRMGGGGAGGVAVPAARGPALPPGVRRRAARGCAGRPSSPCPAPVGPRLSPWAHRPRRDGCRVCLWASPGTRAVGRVVTSTG